MANGLQVPVEGACRSRSSLPQNCAASLGRLRLESRHDENRNEDTERIEFDRPCVDHWNERVVLDHVWYDISG